MTLANTTIIKCGNCGSKIEVCLYCSVNVDVDPYLKEKVLSGNINSGFCDKCNTINRVDNAFLYHDMNIGLMAWVYGEQFKNRADEITKSVLEETQEVNLKLPKSFMKPRATIVVFGIDELKEKLKKAGDLLRSELKLYSREKSEMKLVATLYIENNKLAIDSKDQKVKDGLYKSINALTENGGIFLFEYIFRNDDLFLEGALVNINHPSFLYALKNCSYLWQSNKVYGGYTIYGFDSCLFELESNNKDVQYFLLGSSEKNLANQKFIMKIFTHNHKNKKYSSYILQRTVQSGPIHNFYRAITLEDRNKWSELYFKTFNTSGHWINDYAQKNARVNFFECYLQYAADEKALQKCDSEKFNFLEKIRNKYSPTEEQEKEKEIIFLERILNLKLPDSYKQFLKKFGSGYDGKIPIPGKPRIFGLSASKEVTSALNATFFLRIKRKDIPKDFVVLGFFDNSNVLCLDLRKKSEDDAPLVKINYMEENTDIKESSLLFSDYLAKEISLINNKQ